MPTTERRHGVRTRLSRGRDVFYHSLREIAKHANNFYTALGIYVVAGGLLAVLGAWGFVALAEKVRQGSTQVFDDAVLHWMGQHRVAWVERVVLEVTPLGTAVVVGVIVVVAGLFLINTDHRLSALLLLIATGGGIVLNTILKVIFSRPRPQIFEWATYATSSSFPSGHAMSAAIVYSTVAYLVARLERRLWARWLTMLGTMLLVLVICFSRVYLGVHYPSDVLAGVIVGLAWAGFCMAGLEASRVFARRFGAAEVLEHERDLTKTERRAAGLEA
jgi:undecaprenyl-diphosphatase